MKGNADYISSVPSSRLPFRQGQFLMRYQGQRISDFEFGEPRHGAFDLRNKKQALVYQACKSLALHHPHQNLPQRPSQGGRINRCSPLPPPHRSSTFLPPPPPSMCHTPERRYAADPFSDEASYVMRITEDEFIDASNPESGLARYMNHASPSKANVVKFIAQVLGFGVRASGFGFWV